MAYPVKCPECGGEGEIAPDVVCPICEGKGKVNYEDDDADLDDE